MPFKLGVQTAVSVHAYVHFVVLVGNRAEEKWINISQNEIAITLRKLTALFLLKAGT